MNLKRDIFFANSFYIFILLLTSTYTQDDEHEQEPGKEPEQEQEQGQEQEKEEENVTESGDENTDNESEIEESPQEYDQNEQEKEQEVEMKPEEVTNSPDEDDEELPADSYQPIAIDPTKSPKEKEKRRETMFNKDKRTPEETGYIDRAQVEVICKKDSICYSSALIVPVCSSDGKTYLNPGVFLCAQKCNESMRVRHFGPCTGYTLPTTTSTTQKTTVVTTPKHKSSEDRVRIRGFMRHVFKWLGMHVHDDGGFYLEDEKENDA